MLYFCLKYAEMFRYFIFLQFKGTDFHGWQKQPNAVTVQQILDEQLSVLFQEKIETTGAGRTDTGVHALDFAAHFDTSCSLPVDRSQFLYKINCLLPKSIAVFDIKPVSADANARFDAISRTYKYFISISKDPFTSEFAYFYPWTLDLGKMNIACKKLFDYTDFTSFSKLHTDVKTNNCQIREATWTNSGNQLVFTITADRFLRNMVRAIVGTMIDVGKGKITPIDFCRIIEKKSRGLAGVSVPPHGLFLTKIEYPSSVFK
jgi:tRNA pseudouridine38-40 synthase